MIDADCRGFGGGDREFGSLIGEEERGVDDRDQIGAKRDVAEVRDAGIVGGRDVRAVARGVNIWKGKITCKPVADTFGYEHVKLEALLG